MDLATAHINTTAADQTRPSGGFFLGLNNDYSTERIINNHMEKEKKSSRGGARPGSGRPKGSRDSVTIKGLLDALDTISPDQSYEEILIEDFLNARHNEDKVLTLKYHNLILNKIMATKMELEVNDSADALEARRLAFAEALAAMTTSHTNKDSK